MPTAAVPQRYEVIERLGKGGMGVVYQARDTRLMRDVALKVMNAEAESSDAALCFHREARAMASLRHTNIVTIYDYSGPEESPQYMSMELVDGTTLSKLVSSRGPLPDPVLFALVHAISSALAHAHEHGVIHRDIKPNNIMVDGTGRVLLLDFGIAKSYTDPGMFGKTLAGQHTTLRGTPEYMAPEQILQKELGPYTDIFSLGTLTYVLCAAASPFKDISMVDIMRHIARHEYVPLEEASPGRSRAVYDLVDDCLQTETDRRPTAADLAQRCAKWLHAHTILNAQQTLADFVAGKAIPATSDADLTTAPTQMVGSAPTTDKVKRKQRRPVDEGNALSSIPPHLRMSGPAKAEPQPVAQPEPAKPAKPAAPKAAAPTPAADETSGSHGKWVALGAAVLVAAGVAVVAWQYLAMHGREQVPVVPVVAATGSAVPFTGTPPTPDPTKSVITLAIAPWARVYIDENFVGTVPEDLRGVVVEPGVHLIKLMHPSFPMQIVRVDVKAGAVHPVSVDMSRR
jgi:serine/threonine protein kinase